jgi:short-subunit dehydrogenase
MSAVAMPGGSAVYNGTKSFVDFFSQAIGI